MDEKDQINDNHGRPREWPLASCPTCRGSVVPVNSKWVDRSQEEQAERQAAKQTAKKASQKARKKTEEGKKKERDRKKEQKRRKREKEEGIASGSAV
jgi:uncharacterized Zn finger protein (UPF0148 family)